MKKRFLNIGCGHGIKKSTDEAEWINIDKYPVEDEVVVRDITRGLPFDSNSVDYIRAYAMLGQIVPNDDFHFVMNECHRVLKKDCELYVLVPHKDYSHAYMDAFNQRHFNEASFEIFDKNHPNYKTELKYQGFQPWHSVRVNTTDNGFLEAHLLKYV